jgi:hypothetical protein
MPKKVVVVLAFDITVTTSLSPNRNGNQPSLHSFSTDRFVTGSLIYFAAYLSLSVAFKMANLMMIIIMEVIQKGK